MTTLTTEQTENLNTLVGRNPIWNKVREELRPGNVLFYDGCHAVYLVRGDRAIRDLRNSPNFPHEVFVAPGYRGAAVQQIKNWFSQSCGLEYLELIEDFLPSRGRTELLIPQFYFEDEVEEIFDMMCKETK